MTAPSRQAILALSTCAAVLAGTGVAAATPTIPLLGVDAPVASTVSTAKAVDRDCTVARRDGAGTVQRQWIAPADGELAARLRGTRRAGDWDLAVFESTSGTRVGSSAGFAADEVVTLTVRKGASLVLQACRRTGGARSLTLSTQLSRLDLSQVATPAGRISLVDVPLADRAAPARLQATGLDVTHDVDSRSARVLSHGDDDLAALRAAGFTARTVIGDVAADDALARTRERRASRRQAPDGPSLPTGRTTYRQYEDYQRELKEIAARFPSIVRPFALRNKTFQGRELQVLEIAHDVGRKDDGRPTFILNGLHHAREWPAAESIMEFAWDLVSNDGKDPRITKLLDEVRFLVMPLTNADGFVVSRGAPDPDPDETTDVGAAYSLATGVVVLGGSLAYKRKNCNPGLPIGALVPCEFAIGTDPNRNYAESWGGPGASSNPNDQSYRGTGPFSEPEPLAVRELVSQANGTSLLTIHNVAALVLRPPGLKADGFAPDEEALKALGQQMADATGYTNQYGFELYDTTGTTDDWAYAATGAFSYTIELGPEDGVFHGAYQRHVVDQYLGTGTRAGKGVREAYLLAAEAARNPAFTSRVAGRAPAGRTLRLTKTFDTETSDVCAVAEALPINSPVALGEGVDPTSCVGTTGVKRVPESLDVTTVVPRGGSFEWWINPSTRPFEAKAGSREVYTLTCEDAGKVQQTTRLFVARGETARVELPCGGTLPALTRPSRGGSTGLRATLGKILSPVSVINRRRRAIVRIGVRGGTLTDVRVRLLAKRGSRVLGEGRLERLTTSRRIQVRLRKGVRVKAGAYRLRLTATQPKGSPITITRLVRIRVAQR
jgi:hypothetical protein